MATMIFSNMKNKMTFAVFLLVILLMAVTASTALLYFEKKLKETIARDQSTFLAAAAAQIDERIFDSLVELDTLADLITPDMLANPDKAQRLLDAHEGARVFFNNSLFLLSRSGRLIAATPRELNLIGKDYSFRDYFKETVATGKICISRPFDSVQKKSHPIVMFTTPVYDARNRIIAVLGGSIAVREQRYLRQLAALKLGQGGYLSLYDANRIVLMHPDQARVLRQDPPGANRLLDQALDGFEGTSETVTEKGVPVIRSVKRLKSTDWILAISYPAAEAYAPIHTARKYFVVGGIAATLCSTLLVWLIMRCLTAPLHTFTRHIRELSDKEEEDRLFLTSQEDEIGILAHAFNWLLMNLEQEKKNQQEQKDFAENLVKNSSLPSFVIDTGHRLMLWNKACEELTGVSSADITGGSARQGEAIYGHERPSLADIVIDGKTDELPSWYENHGRSPLIANGWHAEGWFRSLNGRDRYLLIDAAPIFNNRGELVAAKETLQDITERKLAEEALRESEERYRSLVENIDVGISLVDDDFRIIMANTTLGTMFNKSAHDLIGKKCFTKCGDEACPDCPGRTAMETGKPTTVERDLVSDDGSRRVMRVNAFPIPGADGKATRFIEVVEDITEQRKAEEEKAHLELQLRHSQKMEALGALAGGIAHDFNNILTAITGYCALIERKSAPDGPVRHYLDKLLTATDRAAALTRGLLAYSRKQPLDPRPVDLHAIVGKVDHLLSRLLGEDIELVILLSDGSLTVLADSLQIEQVLMNLATNARDAMPEGGVLHIAAGRIEIGPEFVRAHGYGQPGWYALVTVSDTGSGMDGQTRERVFEPFFTTKEAGRGTGLGLSIAYGIIKQHNGYINVYSEPGKGTTFTIYLPLSGRPEEESPPTHLPRPTGGNETILLIEDDGEIRATLQELLEGEGYVIIEATDGEDGIAKFREHGDAVQLLILDVVMPRKNGKAVYEEIRAVRPGIRAIFMSGYTADILNAKGVLQDDLNFIAKPVVMNKLLAKIREVLEQ